ncbi:elongation factor P hydroxylase [Psychrobacter urativorans]|uniref:elongation factor P hydroxylase n=1 Tax=Psychrobacter urativorans TaxID=45610 RepID=UPI00191A03BA|nr:elongation factor P hydroxylase [Psychrobacter urativorans]
MMSNNTSPDFTTLFVGNNKELLLQRLIKLNNKATNESDGSAGAQVEEYLEYLKPQWQQLTNGDQAEEQKNSDSAITDGINNINGDVLVDHSEQAATDWLMNLFNTLFAKHHVQLVRGEHEPEYFPAYNGHPARVEFAHGFFASALHEASHWCVAGSTRRQLADFGYWYAPDGRSSAQQQTFERVEIRPQALECLFTLACKRTFQVSQDNLFADFDTSHSTFAKDVYQQASHYITRPQTLPNDAQTLLRALLMIC